MNTMNCKTCNTHLPDLLLEDGYEAAHPEIAAHLKECESCAKELEELRATYELMDEWTAPEPSQYFDSRLRARVREAAAAQPEGLFERVYAFVTFSTGLQLRSAMAGVLMLVLLLGGGSFAGFELANRPQPQPSATVNDLKILDNNAQALQQMDQLLDPAANDDSGDPPTS
jgi:anti-sigma factor RsiW